MTSSPVLHLYGLTKTFGSVQAAQSISLELFKGEVLALLGENGAGKTTLMNMLFGHYMPALGLLTFLTHRELLILYSWVILKLLLLLG